MPVISRDVAEDAIRPFQDEFVAVVRNAWRDWKEGPFAPTMQCKRVRANVVWNQMLVHSKRVFDAREGITFEEKMKAYRGLLVGGKIFIRMKKADEKLLSRNYPTKSALAYVDQTQDMFDGVARLDMVYQLDKSETEIERIVLVQRHRKAVAWTIDLLGADPVVQNVIPFVEPPAPENGGSVADRIVKPRNKSKDGKQDVSTG